MKKLKLERSLKLRKEDTRGRTFNVLSNSEWKDQEWISSFGEQTEKVLPTVSPFVEIVHNEKRQISSKFSVKDLENEKLRVNMDYKPKKHITFASSTRYKYTPRDNGIW
jgi:methyltransferase-like protein